MVLIQTAFRGDECSQRFTPLTQPPLDLRPSVRTVGPPGGQRKGSAVKKRLGRQIPARPTYVRVFPRGSPRSGFPSSAILNV